MSRGGARPLHTSVPSRRHTRQTPSSPAWAGLCSRRRRATQWARGDAPFARRWAAFATPRLRPGLAAPVPSGWLVAGPGRAAGPPRLLRHRHLADLGPAEAMMLATPTRM
eukprot:13030407-Alexandrium_andersonii.AAC.1